MHPTKQPASKSVQRSLLRPLFALAIGLLGGLGQAATASGPAARVSVSVDSTGTFVSGGRAPGTTTISGTLRCDSGWSRGAPVRLILTPNPTVQPTLQLDLTCGERGQTLAWTGSFATFGGDIEVAGTVEVRHPNGRWYAGYPVSGWVDITP